MNRRSKSVRFGAAVSTAAAAVSCLEIVRRYRARLHVSSRARAAIERRTHAVTDVFRTGDALPAGDGREALARALAT